MRAGEKVRLGVLGSGKGSNLEAIFRAISDRPIHAEVKCVLSDNPHAGILGLARSRGVRAEYVDPGRSKSRLDSASEHNIVDALRRERVDLVLFAGFMRIAGPDLIAAFPRRIINIHPSLLPKFPGLRAWEQALAAGEKVTGCTVHYVDKGIDTGEVIAQARVDIFPGDNPEALHARIQEAEHILYPEVLDILARKRPFVG